MKTSKKRESILETANRLFEMNGFHATGVDRLASEAGVTKRTLYKYFGSKEGLIEAVLRTHHTKMMEQTRSKIFSIQAQGDAQLMACFELYREWFAHPTFSGCIFVKTINEFSNCASKLSSIARESKQAIYQLLVELSEIAGAKDPRRLADQLQLLLEGSITLAQSGRGPEIIDTAKLMAKDLIAAARA
jgi:AcrR family transcriptional regulator